VYDPHQQSGTINTKVQEVAKLKLEKETIILDLSEA